MAAKFANMRSAIWLLFLICAEVLAIGAGAASCTTQSQMTPVQRDALAGAARTMLWQVQTGNVQTLRDSAIPAVAADFSGMTRSVSHLQPLVKSAAITVDEVYLLDASNDTPGAPQTDFFCGSPVVALNFPGLPPGTYALAIVHATGVPQPLQISLILSKSANDRWLLAGLFDKPMVAAGHDGLWYWTSARRYAQSKMDWSAWLYYRLAANLLDPLDFLSSPNLEKLQHEADLIRPPDLPGKAAMTFYTEGELMTVTAIDTTTALGGLDLDVHYTPDAAQAIQLHDPSSARRQVTAVMEGLLKMHPELQAAFHGIWVHADQGTASLFALELPMDQIAGGLVPASTPAYTVSPLKLMDGPDRAIHRGLHYAAIFKESHQIARQGSMGFIVPDSFRQKAWRGWGN